ncbi:MAG: response regulator [Planctomycetota bacterium]|jgi:DNA-binding response OmpR family regulator
MILERLFGKKRKALVIEDEPHIRKLMAKHLEVQDFEVHHAGNGQEAFEVLAIVEPDLLVTDLMMPKMNGVEFIREFRKINPTTPIIVITGVGRDEVTDKITRKWENVAILKKPFKATELIRQVHTFCPEGKVRT